jgi:hypothetical protein
MSDQSALVPAEQIEQAILLLRGHKVMLDRDLAKLYGVETKSLKRAVKRNLDRFPPDFMFELSGEEAESVRCQFGTLQKGQHLRYRPYAFTEQGVAMLSSVLKSPQAVLVNIAVMRAFVRLRETLSLHKELAHRLTELEHRIESHDESTRTLFEAIRRLMTPAGSAQKRRIGFHAREKSAAYRVREKR